MKLNSPSFFLSNLLAFLMFFSSSCSHQTKNIEIGKFASYNNSVNELNLDSSFAFTVDQHDYYFVYSFTDGYLNDCARFDGYKDDQLTYSFPNTQFKKLSDIYSSKEKIDVKISRAFNFINSLSPPVFLCQKLPPAQKKSIGKLINNGVEVGMNFVVYGSMVVLLSPIVVPMALTDSFIENRLEKRLREMRLGMSSDQVKKIMLFTPKEEIVDDHVVQIFELQKPGDHAWKRLVFIYKNQKLIAYVWGLRPK